MDQLIVVIVNRFLAALSWSAIKKSKDEKRLTRIGTELCLFYIALRRICTNGEKLVDILESNVRFADRYESTHGHPLNHDIYFADLFQTLTYQGTALIDLCDSAGRLVELLEVLAPVELGVLEPIVMGKAAAINELAVALMGGHRDPNGLMVIMGADPAKIDLMPRSLQAEFDSAQVLSVAMREQRNSLRADQIEIVRTYLRVNEPREALQILSDASMRLRDHLLEHFSMRDLLLSVSDHKFAGTIPTTLDRFGPRRPKIVGDDHEAPSDISSELPLHVEGAAALA